MQEIFFVVKLKIEKIQNLNNYSYLAQEKHQSCFINIYNYYVNLSTKKKICKFF